MTFNRASLNQKGVQAKLRAGYVRRAVRVYGQAQAVPHPALHGHCGAAKVARQGAQGNTRAGKKASRGVESRGMWCHVERGCPHDARNLCIVCDRNSCDRHTDGVMLKWRDAEMFGYACLMCESDVQDLIARGMMVMVDAAQACASNVSVEDCIKVQRIMEALTQPTRRSHGK